MTRIMLADDHEIVRKGLRTMLEKREGWSVCGEAATGREAVRLAAELRPDVAVIDLSMPDLDGLAATRQIRREAPDTEVLVFTMHDTPPSKRSRNTGRSSRPACPSPSWKATYSPRWAKTRGLRARRRARRTL
jgi:CheY-like chemotaxis protein